MTQLLVSVKNLDEAKIALATNVDIIDLKNPADGALGALEPDVIQQVVSYVAGRKPVSATIGNLPMQAKLIAQKIQQTEYLGVDIIKVGFLDNMQTIDCIDEIHKYKFKTKIMAVIFADQIPSFDLIAKFSAAGFYGVMLDTQSKLTKNLFDYSKQDDVERFVKTAKSASLFVGLAGKLSVNLFNSALDFSPNFIGVRSAICAAEVRESSICREKITLLTSLLHKNNILKI